MFNYYIKDFNIDNIISAIENYEMKEARRIKKAFNYYNSKQDIGNKEVAEGRPNNKIVTNYIKEIIDVYHGLISPMEGSDSFIEDNMTEVSDAIRDALITGVGYIYAYRDGNPLLKRMYPDQCMIFRDTSVSHKQVGSAFWSYYDVFENGFTQTYVDLYVLDASTIYYYSGKSLRGVELQEQWAHHIDGHPIQEIKITSHYDAIPDPVFSLQDMANVILSSYADGRASFSNPFLLITGMGIDSETAEGLIDGEHKILNLPLADGRAEYLIKPDSGSDVVTVLADIDTRVYKAVSLPNLSEDIGLGASSGAAIICKFIKTVKVCDGYRKSLEKCIKGISDVTSGFTFEWKPYFDDIDQESESVNNVVADTRNEAQEVIEE